MYEVQPGSRGVVGTAPLQHAMFGNYLLDALPREEIARLSPHLRRVFLHRGQALAVTGEVAEHIYFPIDALLWSWTTTTGAERPTSLLTIGRRGATPLEALLELQLSDGNVTVLSPGSTWRISRTALQGVLRSFDAPIRRLLSRFAYSSFAVCAYRLACNSEHNVDRRLARWLLFIMDETGKPEASLTHQQIADVAAIRRPSVSLAFSDLQRRGIVRVHHGLVQILDRDRLEKEACPCYGAIHGAMDSVLHAEKVSELSASG